MTSPEASVTTSASAATVARSNTSRGVNRNPTRRGPFHQLDRDDAVATQLEERVINADSFQAEYLREYLAEQLLHRSAWSATNTCRRIGEELGQQFRI